MLFGIFLLISAKPHFSHLPHHSGEISDFYGYKLQLGTEDPAERADLEIIPSPYPLSLRAWYSALIGDVFQ